MLAFLVPALLGVLWQPGAGSSGVPGVIAFLNGCNIPNALTPKVWAVKVLGLCCSAQSAVIQQPSCGAGSQDHAPLVSE